MLLDPEVANQFYGLKLAINWLLELGVLCGLHKIAYAIAAIALNIARKFKF